MERGLRIMTASWVPIAKSMLATALVTHVVPALAGENIALRKSYTLDPKADYPHCSDSGDMSQLTDGESLGANWLVKTTVGWRKPTESPRIVIDLEKPEAIQEVRVHSIGGGRAHVYFPEALLMLVSDDGTAYRPVGAADSLALEQNRHDSILAPKTPHIFSINAGGARGRFVMLVLAPEGKHLFVDEIEVIRASGQAAETAAETIKAVTGAKAPGLLALARARAEIRLGLDQLRQAMGDSASPDLMRRLDSLSTGLDRHCLQGADRCLQQQRDLESLRAAWLATLTDKPLLTTTANPMAPFRPASPPLPSREQASGSQPARLEVRIWQGEYEAAGLNVLNSSSKAVRVTVRLTPLQGPDQSNFASDDTVTLRLATAVAAHGIGSTGDALIRMPRGGAIFQPGEAAQIWLTIHNPRLPPGRYAFAIDLESKPQVSDLESYHDMIQAGLTVVPLKFPDKPTLKTCTWSYLERADMTANHLDEAIADLRAHYVNVQTLYWGSSLPVPRIAAGGEVEFDFTKHDIALERYRDFDTLLFYWSLGPSYREIPHMGKFLSPEWKRAMKSWLTSWIDHLKRRGIGYDRFAMYPFDEMLPDEFFELVRFIREDVDPKMRFYANSRGDDGGREMARISPYVDIWTLHDWTHDAKFGATETNLREGPAQFWSYNCLGPAKSKPPLGYYRLQMWRAFARGDTGCGFWAYVDIGQGAGNAWNDFESIEGKYAVVYGSIGKPPELDLGGEALVPSRRWEAWREGVEDYEYLVSLRAAIDEARRAGRWDATDEAQRTLNSAVRSVVESSSDPEIVYRARGEITDAIIKLKNP